MGAEECRHRHVIQELHRTSQSLIRVRRLSIVQDGKSSGPIQEASGTCYGDADRLYGMSEKTSKGWFLLSTTLMYRRAADASNTV